MLDPAPEGVAVQVKVAMDPMASSETLPGVGPASTTPLADQARAFTFVASAVPLLVTVSTSWNGCMVVALGDSTASSTGAGAVAGTPTVLASSTTWVRA